jgi:hypothetical protein
MTCVSEQDPSDSGRQVETLRVEFLNIQKTLRE